MAKADVLGGVEIVKDRLYFITLRTIPRGVQTEQHHFFTVDDLFIYEPFFADFGPLNMGHLYHFCQMLDKKLADSRNTNRRIYYYSSVEATKRANAAFFIAAYSVMRLGMTPDEAMAPLNRMQPPFVPFRDASAGASTFHVTVADCVNGLYKAAKCGLFDFNTFNVDEYQFYERVENGDMNWIVQNKFLAFSGPHASHAASEATLGYIVFTPEDYVPYFLSHNITAVVRLNKKEYDRRKFVEAGIHHYDLYFADGSNPSELILRKFLEIAEGEQGAIAVHCRAGLGRTGTLIAAYIMKHYRFTAQEAIGYIRVCRPGSVIGPQQNYLSGIQMRLWKMGEAQSRRRGEVGEMQPKGSFAAPLNGSTSTYESDSIPSPSANGQYLPVGSSPPRPVVPSPTGYRSPKRDPNPPSPARVSGYAAARQQYSPSGSPNRAAGFSSTRLAAAAYDDISTRLQSMRMSPHGSPNSSPSRAYAGSSLRSPASSPLSAALYQAKARGGVAAAAVSSSVRRGAASPVANGSTSPGSSPWRGGAYAGSPSRSPPRGSGYSSPTGRISATKAETVSRPPPIRVGRSPSPASTRAARSPGASPQRSDELLRLSKPPAGYGSPSRAGGFGSSSPYSSPSRSPASPGSSPKRQQPPGLRGNAFAAGDARSIHFSPASRTKYESATLARSPYAAGGRSPPRF